MNPVVVPATTVILSRLSTWIMLNQPRIQGFLSTVAGIERLGQVFERSKAKSSSSSAPARGSMTSGGGSVLPPDPEKEPGKERKSDTPQAQTAFKDQKVSSGEWHSCKDWKKTYESADGTTRFVKTVEKSEFEVYKKVDKQWEHVGIMRPSEGRIRVGKGDIINPDGTIGIRGTGRFAKGIKRK